MSNRNKRQASALEEISQLKAKRRLDIIKCGAALVVILLLTFGKIWLESNGYLDPHSILSGPIMMVATIGLAIFAGSASIDFTKSGHLIEECRIKGNLSKEDVKRYESESR